jgi:lactam utilization protein B
MKASPFYNSARLCHLVNSTMTETLVILLNCDMGESFDIWCPGDDRRIICVHSDTPGADVVAKAVHDRLVDEGYIPARPVWR